MSEPMLKEVSINLIRPFFGEEEYMDFEVVAWVGAEMNKTTVRVETKYIKELGEAALDKAVLLFKQKMGWKP